MTLDQESQNILELNEYSDDTLKYNFGFTAASIRALRENAITIRSLIL